MLLLLGSLTIAAATTVPCPGNATIGFWPALCDEQGGLVPRADPVSVLQSAMSWYSKCPDSLLHPTKPVPVWFLATFMDGNYKMTKNELIPAMQHGVLVV